jgi:hypothetical protein
MTEVSAATRVPHARSATATTPRCPPGHELTSGGFSFAGSHNAFLSAAHFNNDNTWSATAYGYFGEVPALTVHGLLPGGKRRRPDPATLRARRARRPAAGRVSAGRLEPTALAKPAGLDSARSMPLGRLSPGRRYD